MAAVSTIGARGDAGNVPHTGVACAFCARGDPRVAPKARPTTGFWVDSLLCCYLNVKYNWAYMTEYELSHALHRIALGDSSAFERFYQATSPKLMSVSYAILRERALAEEALQDTYLKIWHAASDYRSDAGSVMCWITSMVRYRAIDMLRNANRQPFTSKDIEQLLDQRASDSLPTAAPDADKLENCMSDLDGTQRQSIHLAFLYGLSHREVSDYLGEALGSIKSWIRRGLDSLKRCLQS